MPSEWRTTTLGNAPLEIIDGDRGRSYPSQTEFSSVGQCLFLNAGNVTTHGFDFSERAFITREKDAQLRKGKLVRDDVVLMTRGTVGNAAYFDDSVPFDHIRINSGMVILRAKPPALLPRYLYFFARSPLFYEQVAALRTGSAQPQLPIRDIIRIELPIPPPDAQHSIVRILGALDDKIELNRKMNETLEQMVRAIFKSWFVDFLPVRAKMAAKANDPQLSVPTAEAGQYFVYALECENGNFYIGHTEDLRQRWQQHSAGVGGRWTKAHPPRRIAYWERLPSRAEAVGREKWLKTGFGRKWLKKEVAASARTQTGEPFRDKGMVDSPLGKIPKGWRVGTLGEVAANPRRSVGPAEIRPGTPYIALEHMPRKSICLADWGTSDEVESGKSAFRKGEVLFGKLRPYFHKVGVAPLDGVCSTDILAVAPKSPHWLAFVLGHVSGDAFVAYTNAGSEGTKMPRTNWTRMAAYSLAIPTDSAAGAFNAVVAPALECMTQHIWQSRTLAAIRDALLPKLMSGEVEVVRRWP